MEKSALRVPERHQPLTPEQLAAWKHLASTFGQEKYALEWCSYREAAEAGIKAMMEEADVLMSNPSVKNAYEHFMLVCELTKENNELKS
jgi:hypothetical protein